MHTHLNDFAVDGCVGMPDGAVVLPLPDDGLAVQVGTLAQHGVDGKHSVRGQLWQQLPADTIRRG